MINFFSVNPNLRPPMRADQSALGRLPISAFQYCEAVRAASSIGWYVFPPMDFSVLFDGKEVFLADEGDWRPLRSQPLPPEMEADWNETFGDTFGPPPNFLEDLTDTGILQIWTGWFATTDPGEHVMMRPLINVHTKSSYWCYEGLVETDKFSPLPLFMNVQLTRTGSEILFQRDFPLFQLMVVPAQTLDLNKDAGMHDIHSELFPADGLDTTLRRSAVSRRAPGQYGAEVRRQRKRSE